MGDGPVVHTTLQGLVDAIMARLPGVDAGPRRFVVGIAAPPAAGKTTLAGQLAVELGTQVAPRRSVILGLDGFHLDDTLLEPAGLRAVKGAPQTFDVAGFAHLLERVKAGESPVYLPVFDRTLELSRNAASVVDESASLVIVEGNYLLLERTPWPAVTKQLDLTIGMHVGTDELERRLVARWVDAGFDRSEAQRRAECNDLPNGQLVIEHSIPPDILWQPSMTLLDDR